MIEVRAVGWVELFTRSNSSGAQARKRRVSRRARPNLRYRQRRSLIFGLAFGRILSFACLLAGIAAARADDYPARPVELVVPFAAGGGTDLLARLLADGLGKRLKQSFVVVNRPGANTNLGTQAVVSAPSSRRRPSGCRS
jgi:hypothetical protein